VRIDHIKELRGIQVGSPTVIQEPEAIGFNPEHRIGLPQCEVWIAFRLAS
jgi:hypothetical protein